MELKLAKSATRHLGSLAARVSNDLHSARQRFGMCPALPDAGHVRTGLVSETEQVLRSRLRTAAFLLFVGFASFLSIYLDPRAMKETSVIAGHVICTVAMGFCAYILCERHGWRLKQLRVFETVIFGLPSLFFIKLQWMEANIIAQRSSELQSLSVLEAYSGRGVIPWVLIIFVYASFIPNTWQRCSAHVIPMAAAPIAFFVYSCLQVPGGTALLWGRPIIEVVLWIAIPTLSAIFAAHTLHALRRRVALARELGSYHLKEKLGEGGMGEVYLGEHILLKRPCAIKLIRPSQANDPKALGRFESEVQATARLTHWNTIEIYDYGHAEDGTFYYAMEYLPGMSLQDLVDTHGPMPTERAIHLLRQVCDGLREAHSMGLIHRDIKPGNIFASYRGGIWDVAKLLDFGLVKSITADDATPTHESTDGLVVGTPLFASPEWTLKDGVLDERSDIYSLGAVGYFLVTGRPVFSHPSAVKLLYAHAYEEPESIRKNHPDVPADFEAVILRCLAKQPEDRFESAEELKNALEECALAQEWKSTHAHDWWRDVDTHHSNHAEPESDPSAATQELSIDALVLNAE